MRIKIMLVVMGFLLLMQSEVLADHIGLNPSNFSFTVKPLENRTFQINMTNNGNSTIPSITFSAFYFSNFNPSNFDLAVNETKIITTNFSAPSNIGSYTDSIIIYTNSTIHTNIPVNFTVSNQTLPPSPYKYYRCTPDPINRTCEEITDVNITVENITIINQTNFFAVPPEILFGLLENLNRSKNANLNALTLMKILEDRNNPLWNQISPQNVLANMSGLGDIELYDALNVLLSQGLITQTVQEVEQQFETREGIILRRIQRVYIASNERLKNETNLAGASSLTWLIIILIVLSLIGFGLYKWRKDIIGLGVRTLRL